MVFFLQSANSLVALRGFRTSRVFELAEYFIIAALAFSVPILFAHSQPVVGPIVNALLIFAAINSRGWKKILSLITLPSVSALIAGALFGSLTVFLVYLIPFIWLGNALLVLAFKAIFLKLKKNYFFSLAAAALLKSSLLFCAAFALNSISLVPALFLTTMGILQFATAIAGGLLAFPVLAAYRKFLC